MLPCDAMRGAVLLLAGCSLVACREASPPASAPSSEAASKRASAEEGAAPAAGAKAGASAEASRALPPLPDDLTAVFGAAHEAINDRLAAPRPELAQPWKTSAEHRAWLEEVLRPWETSWIEAAQAVHDARPKIDAEADDAAWARHERATFVHSILTTTQTLENARVQAGIPFPADVTASEAAMKEARRDHGQGLDAMLGIMESFGDQCTTFAGGEAPVPSDLEPWAEECKARIADTLAALCAVEKRMGFEASVPCSGTRPLAPPAPPERPAGKVRSMKEMAEIVEAASSVCFVAEDVLDEVADQSKRLKAWRDGLADEGVEHPEVLAAVDEAIAAAPGPAKAQAFRGKLLALTGGADLECAAFDTLLGG